MNWLKRITLIFLLLSATSCAMAPTEPPPTDITLAEPIQPSPTATASHSPTNTIVASPTGTAGPAGPASRTPRPTNTWMPITPAATPRIVTPWPLADPRNPTGTPLALPDLVWTAGWGEVRELPAGKAAWSPVANDLFLIGCADEAALDLAMLFYLAQAPTFTLTSYETPGFSCSTYHGYTEIDWRPDGQDVFFNALPIEDPDREFYDLGYWAPAYSAYYYLHLSDGLLQQFLDIYWLPEIAGWMNNETVVYLDYFGGGHRNLTILHLPTGETLARSYLYGHWVDSVNSEYVVATSGEIYSLISAVALGLEPVRPIPEPEPPHEWIGPN
ncbi:MAG: hypothetical protein KDE04_00400, partial [Anaerolineales bacterium]|nr:hypothetical protein [Anaerolineales bacterium]